MNFFIIPSITALSLFFSSLSFCMHEQQFYQLSSLPLKARSFTCFSKLLPELQFRVMQQIKPAKSLDAFALTSHEKYAQVNQYKENQKPFIKKYLYALYTDDSVEVKKIKDSYPNIPDFYYFPVPGIEKNEREVYYLMDPAGYHPTRWELQAIQTQLGVTGHDCHSIDTKPTITACLSGDYHQVIECLNDKQIQLSAPMVGLMIAIKEHDHIMSELLLDKTNRLFGNKKFATKFYNKLLLLLKLTKNKDAFELVVEKMPYKSSLPNAYCFVSLLFDVLDFMKSRNDVFDINDIELVQKKMIITKPYKQDDQHCIIL